MTKRILVALLILLFVLGVLILWPSNRKSPPNVVLSLVAVTNWPNGSPGAVCKLLNRGERMIFAGPPYSGLAQTPDGEIELSAPRFTYSLGGIPPGSHSIYHVTLPTNTVSWKITVTCNDSDLGSQLGWRIVRSRAKRFLPHLVWEMLFRQTLNREFDVSTPIITNVPPYTAASTSQPPSDPSATAR